MKKNEQRTIELAEIDATMKTASGRNVLSRILVASGLYDSTFVKDNVNETMRRSIRRDFGVWLESEIKQASPGLYFTLLKELENGYGKSEHGTNDSDDYE